MKTTFKDKSPQSIETERKKKWGVFRSSVDCHRTKVVNRESTTTNISYLRSRSETYKIPEQERNAIHAKLNGPYIKKKGNLNQIEGKRLRNCRSDGELRSKCLDSTCVMLRSPHRKEIPEKNKEHESITVENQEHKSFESLSEMKLSVRRSERLDDSDTSLSAVSTDEKKSKSAANSPSELNTNSDHRPKRLGVSKTSPISKPPAGLRWKEEADLQKALTASLHQRKQRLLQQTNDDMSICDRNGFERPNNTKEECRRGSSNERPSVVRAQRKFAQSESHLKKSCMNRAQRTLDQRTNELLFATKTNTVDFLTFLCLRGTHLLPKALEVFEHPNEETTDASITEEIRSTMTTATDSITCNPLTPQSQDSIEWNDSISLVDAEDTSTNDGAGSVRTSSTRRSPSADGASADPDAAVQSTDFCCSRKLQLSDTTNSAHNSPCRSTTPPSPYDSMPVLTPHRPSIPRKFAVRKSAENCGLRARSSPKLSPLATKNGLHGKRVADGAFVVLNDDSSDSTVAKKPRPPTSRAGRKSSPSSSATPPRRAPESFRRLLRKSTMLVTAAVMAEHSAMSPATKRGLAVLNSYVRSDVPIGVVGRLSLSPPKKTKKENKKNSSMNDAGRNAVKCLRENGANNVIKDGDGSNAKVISTVGDVSLKNAEAVRVDSTKIANTKTGSPAKTCAEAFLKFVASNKSTKDSDLCEKESSNIPTFYPLLEEFKDPWSYIQRISMGPAKHYGMCHIVPPKDWQIDSNISQQLRFTPRTQYIHKLCNRWGLNSHKLACIKKHFESERNGKRMENIPVFGGVEIDLVRLSQAVLETGGLQKVLDENSWPDVMAKIRIPNQMADKASRLYDIYCNHLLSYDTLSAAEKDKLERRVIAERSKQDVDKQEPCVVKSRTKSLGEFFTTSRNLTAMYFKNEPTAQQAEAEYWRLAEDGNYHIAVLQGKVDVCGGGGGRAGGGKVSLDKGSTGSKVRSLSTLVNGSDCALRQVGQLSCTDPVCRPVLTIGMLFSTSSWSRDYNMLPSIHYLHTGADIIWYCIPGSEEKQLTSVINKVIPGLVTSDEPLSLPRDSFMMSASALRSHGITVRRVVQRQGQMIVVFPESFSSSISVGYNIAETIRFAPTDWISLGCNASKSLAASSTEEPFSMDELLFKLVENEDTSTDFLSAVLPCIEELVASELEQRQRLMRMGLTRKRRRVSAAHHNEFSNKKKKNEDEDDDDDCEEILRCEYCLKICYLSMVEDEQSERVYCVSDAVVKQKARRNFSSLVLVYQHNQSELKEIITRLQTKLSSLYH